MMEGSGAESGAGTVLVTNGSGCGSGMPKTYGSYGAGSGSVTLLGGRGNGAVKYGGGEGRPQREPGQVVKVLPSVWLHTYSHTLTIWGQLFSASLPFLCFRSRPDLYSNNFIFLSSMFKYLRMQMDSVHVSCLSSRRPSFAVL